MTKINAAAPQCNPQTEVETTASSFYGVKIADEMMDYATLKGSLGEAATSIEDGGFYLWNHGDERSAYPLDAESRAGKLGVTTKTFWTGGAQAGALVADIMMIPYDFIFGRGKKPKQGEDSCILDEGVLGHGGNFVSEGLGLSSELVGMGVGAVAGVVDGAAVLGTEKKDFGAWIANHAVGVGKGFATAVGTASSFVIGAALDVARLASLAVKYTISGIVGLGGLIVGFIGGSIRAIFNK